MAFMASELLSARDWRNTRRVYLLAETQRLSGQQRIYRSQFPAIWINNGMSLYRAIPLHRKQKCDMNYCRATSFELPQPN